MLCLIHQLGENSVHSGFGPAVSIIVVLDDSSVDIIFVPSVSDTLGSGVLCQGHRPYLSLLCWLQVVSTEV